MEFKVGDRVRCIKPNANRGCSGAGWQEGFEFVINRISDETNDSAIVWPEKGSGIYTYAIEIVSSENSSFTKHTMEKKVYRVLVIDTKTENVIEKLVVANDEKFAFFKAGKDLKEDETKVVITQIATFEVKEPVQAVLVKEVKDK